MFQWKILNIHFKYMGGLLSTENTDKNTDKTDNMTTDKKAPTLENRINQYAADLILRTNFKDMQSLMRKEECDKLVILTSKVIDQHFHKADINVLKQKVSGNDGDNGLFSEPVEYIKESKLHSETDKMQNEKSKLCQGLARYYVKIAHLFAAITQTVSPTYVYEVSGMKNRYYRPYETRPYETRPYETRSYSPNASAYTPNTRYNREIDHNETIQNAGVGYGIETGNTSSSTAKSPKKQLELKWDQLRELENYEHTKFIKTKLNGFCNKRLSTLDPSGILQTHEPETLFEIKPDLCNSNKSYKNLESVIGIPDLSELYKDEYDPETKQYSEMSENMKQQYNEDLKNFYKAFTGKKSMPSTITKFSDIPLTDYSNLRGCNTRDEQFPLDFSFVGGNVYKNNEGEIFFSSADKLVNVKLDNVTLDAKWPHDATFTVDEQNNFGKAGSKIQLWGRFSNDGERTQLSFINEPYGMFNRGQKGSLKIKLFNDYASKIREMVATTQKNKDKLLKILEQVFSKSSIDGFDVVKVSDELTEQKLDKLISETRDIIIQMYLSCEKDFKEALNIFDAIIDKQILEDSISISERLETKMNEFVAADPEILEREIAEVDEQTTVGSDADESID